MAKGKNTTLDKRIEIVSHCIANNKDYGKTMKRYGVSISKFMDGSGNTKRTALKVLLTDGTGEKMNPP